MLEKIGLTLLTCLIVWLAGIPIAYFVIKSGINKSVKTKEGGKVETSTVGGIIVAALWPFMVYGALKKNRRKND